MEHGGEGVRRKIGLAMPDQWAISSLDVVLAGMKTVQLASDPWSCLQLQSLAYGRVVLLLLHWLTVYVGLFFFFPFLDCMLNSLSGIPNRSLNYYWYFTVIFEIMELQRDHSRNASIPFFASVCNTRRWLYLHFCYLMREHNGWYILAKHRGKLPKSKVP